MNFWRNIKDFILSYEYSNNQSFLVSFPKAGRSWLIYMLDQIQEKMHTNVCVLATHDMSEIIIENGTRQDPTILFNFTGRFRYRRSKVLILVRDPRDIIVSHFYQVTKRAKNPFRFSSMSAFIRNQKLGFRRIIHFFNLWHDQKHIPNDFLIIKYESLLEDGVTELCKICDFIGLKYNLSIIREVYIQSSANIMREKELNDELVGFRSFGKELNELKIRNAKQGSYLAEMNQDDINFCNIEMKELNKYFGYNI